MEASHHSIVGVFRDRVQADLAVEELIQAGFRADQVRSIVYGLNVAEEEHAGAQLAPEASRTIVTVDAGEREPEALGILFQHGANNADLPPGMALEHSILVEAQPETAEHIPQQGIEEGSTPYTFFEEVKEPGHPDDIMIIDNPNFPHG